MYAVTPELSGGSILAHQDIIVIGIVMGFRISRYPI